MEPLFTDQYKREAEHLKVSFLTGSLAFGFNGI